MEKKVFTTVDDYINAFPETIQQLLQQVRTTVQKAAPDATEAISYGMPTFKLKIKNLVHFAAFKNHIGFYPTPNGIEAFKEELSKFKGAKGSVQFPLHKPLPLELIGRIVNHRMENQKKEAKKPAKGNYKGK